LAVLTLLALMSCGPSPERITIRIRGVDFSVEVARTEQEKARGLMKRNSLDRRQGMIFVFEQDDHLSFWMKDTSIPLSIGFISQDGRITEIRDMDPFSLKTIKSRYSCRYALELAKGAFQDAGAAEGDTIELPAGFK
jgi:uncharacterized protein